MIHVIRQGGVCLIALFLGTMFCAAGEQGMSGKVPENTYRGELIAYPGPWATSIGRAHIILVRDQELIDLANEPDKVLDLTLTHDKREESLRMICEKAQKAGQRTLVLSFDQFFAQYRPGQHRPRELYPDTPDYVKYLSKIARFAQGYGLALELSLLTPLEIGPGYRRETGESGVWMHYRKGLRDPKTGEYSVQLWRQQSWANNKGIVHLEDAGVRVFAFREQPVGGTRYLAVKPEDIIDITDTAQVDVYGLSGDEDHAGSKEISALGDYRSVRIRIHGTGGGAEGMDRVLVVQQYRSPEMDYFSLTAKPFLKKLVDTYVDAGVRFNALYADETHIQQDWGYFNHHDNGTFALRYVSPGFQQRFAERYGSEYADFAKYLVYFTYGQNDTAQDLSAKNDTQHVFGASPEAIEATALFRSRYYALLQDDVVDLFLDAKEYLEERMGHQISSRAHATWAESPTIDYWDSGTENRNLSKYEYTPNFVWSNTVHQAAAACADYFRWGDFLHGTGTDHSEGGWLDRDYYGFALASSLGILNRVPNAYAAHWGSPRQVRERFHNVGNAYGTSPAPWYGMVYDMEHRDVEVLMLYPIDLVAADERFGSWMNQYGYANLITQEKLLERGEVKNGAVEVAGRRFTTLTALFEPFPSAKLLDMMAQLAEQGGTVIWSGPPPVIDNEGKPVLDRWEKLMGVNHRPRPVDGLIAPGQQVVFSGTLEGLAPMTILTSLLVDHVYPVTPREGTAVAAQVKKHVVGTVRTTAQGGKISFLGFRPRDDQAASLGYETRYWFDILQRLGAYQPTGAFGDTNDNTENYSRSTGYFSARFPNGATSVAPHFKDLEEAWSGGFARKRDEDDKLVATLDLPTEDIVLADAKINGHAVTYTGKKTLAFRVDDAGNLVAFSGEGAGRITIDGRETVFADKPMPLVAWAPVPEARRVQDGAVLLIRVHGKGTVHIPAPDLPRAIEVVRQGAIEGSRGATVPHEYTGGMVTFTSPGNGWYYVVPGKG